MMDDVQQTENTSLFEAPPLAEQERMCEAILFASAEPVSAAELNARMPHGCDAAEALVHLSDELLAMLGFADDAAEGADVAAKDTDVPPITQAKQ